MALTKRQKEMLDFISEFIAENGYSPTLEEICEHFDLASKATVHKHLENLEEKGLISRDYNLSRSIEVLVQEDAPAPIRAPMLGYIAAGVPIEAINNPDFVSVPAEMIGRKNCYVLKVRGDSMIDEHIADGDMVIIEETDHAENGDTVVALINYEDATLKKYFREGRQVRLQPANPKYEPIYVDETAINIQGRVIGVLRKY